MTFACATMVCILLMLYFSAGDIKVFCIPFIRQLMVDSFCLGGLGQRYKKFVSDVSAVVGFLKMEFCRNPFFALMLTCRIFCFLISLYDLKEMFSRLLNCRCTVILLVMLLAKTNRISSTFWM